MPLHLYNTLSRSLEEFRPIQANSVKVYACGPTVYRLPHVGNYRTFVFNDLLHRYLEWKGFTVQFVMNLTDVEDKIINDAVERGITINDVTAPVIDAFHSDLAQLGIEPADAYPRATQHIDQMVELIGRLHENGHAYTTQDSVYFDISSFPAYGKLSRIELEDTRAGAGLADRGGIDADEYEKADARDFALWKAAKESDRAVGAVWSTPWGDGRPGWHIECSAMSIAQLGETFDIHTGGEDLVFPHHEDEIAQSEGATVKPFVNYWLHVKHLLVNGEKMSKSRGNDYKLGDLIDRGYRPAAIRYLLLSAHYRKELNFTFDGLGDAAAAIRRVLDLQDRLTATPTGDEAASDSLRDAAATALREFEDALDDDLNVSAALAAVFRLVRESNAALDALPSARAADLAAVREAFDSMDRVLGVFSLARAELEPADSDFAAWVEERIAARQSARTSRDFKAADAIRDELSAAGVILEDTAHGPRWKRA